MYWINYWEKLDNVVVWIIMSNGSNNLRQLHIELTSSWNGVVYWPPTRASSQNRKCTCVNNRCIRSRNIRILPWLSRGWIECEIVTLAGRILDVKLLYNPSDKKFKSVGVKMQYREPAPSRVGPQAPDWAIAVGVQSPRQLERRCWNEDHVPERVGPQAPGWAAQENGKETLLWP